MTPIQGFYNSRDKTFLCSSTGKIVRRCEEGIWAWIKHLFRQNISIPTVDGTRRRTLYVPMTQVHEVAPKAVGCAQRVKEIFMGVLNAPDDGSEVAFEDPSRAQLNALSDAHCRGKIGGVYITATDSRPTEVRKILQESAKDLPERCHIGFGGWHNFDIMVLRGSAYGVICDYNPDNKLFLEKTIELLKSSDTREAFVERIVPFVTREKSKFIQKSDVDVGEEIRNELTREGSWLSRSDSFGIIKRLAEKDRIVAITANICDSRRFTAIIEILQKRGATVDTVYLSNICDFLNEPRQLRAYESTGSLLIQPQTLVISAQYVSALGRPVQKIAVGSIPS